MTCTIVFLQVGNADCTLVKTPDFCAIVDLPKQRLLDDRLKRHELRTVDRVFVTHDHADHFLGLERLATWLENRARREGAMALHLPDGLWQRALEKLRKLKGEEQVASLEYQRLQSAMDKIKLWDQQGRVQYCPLSAGHHVPDHGELSFKVLHPSWLEIETQRANRQVVRNEGSLVLRIRYGEFAVVLMADLEGEGLTSLLDRTDRGGPPASIQCNVLKIPHHGAWPGNAHDLVALLERADPEMAVLSVGSKNNYGHVRPELFRALRDLRNQRSLRLRIFACTEVTRTCALPAADLLPRGRSLPSTRPCAGDVIVEAETDGHWSWPGQVEHRETVKGVPFAACLSTH